MPHVDPNQTAPSDELTPTGRFQRAPRGVVLVCPGQGLMPRDLTEQLLASDPDLVQAYVDRLGGASIEQPRRDFAGTQAALVVVGVSRARRALSVIEAPDAPLGPLVATAGHSLGELVALFAAGAIDGRQAVRLAADRGAAFDRAHEPSWDDAGMLALVGRQVHAAIDDGLLARHGVEFANDNTPDQVVVAGPLAGLQSLSAEAARRGLRAVRLETTGPAHSSYLRAAGDDFFASLNASTFGEARVPVYCNLTAQPFTDHARELASLLSAPVRWRQSLLNLERLRPAILLDIGPGKALAKMTRKTISTPAAGLDDLVESRLAA